MNILFINYGDFQSNSLNHITVYAKSLASLGHNCCVALSQGSAKRRPFPESGFTALRHSDLCNKQPLFPNGHHADIIHAWTPRHGVLETLLKYQRSIGTPARVITHLEDNEQHLLSHTAGIPFNTLLRWNDRQLGRLLRKGLIHPIRHQLLLSISDLVTLITPKLKDFVPNNVASRSLSPSIDHFFSQPQSTPVEWREHLGIKSRDRVIVYPGGANQTNASELQSLYSAVAILNGRGLSVKLIRTGPSTPWFTALLSPEEKTHAIELGFVERICIPPLFALADVLVQPGCLGPFNDYRLPSKIPEFLASGRPVIIPATNLAHSMTEGIEALFLHSGTSNEIADLCERIFKDPCLASRLGVAGRAYAETHFNMSRNGAYLESIYKEVLRRPQTANWSLLKNRGYNESDLLPLSSGSVPPNDIIQMAERRRNSWQHRLHTIWP
jgi:glycosyltransferase involved in cell wall biosynthesis